MIVAGEIPVIIEEIEQNPEVQAVQQEVAEKLGPPLEAAGKAIADKVGPVLNAAKQEIAEGAEALENAAESGLQKVENALNSLVNDAPSSTTACEQAAPAAEAESAALKFGENDLVYGPSAGGKLRALQQEAGGKLLTDLEKPYGVDWPEFTQQTLQDAANTGRQVRFDLTNMDDIPGALAGEGPQAGKVTSQELRFIRDNWDSFSVKPKFYSNGSEVPAPWSP